LLNNRYPLANLRCISTQRPRPRDPHRPANPARHLPPDLQHRTHPPRPTPHTIPAQAYAALPKAAPPDHTTESHFRIRHDTVDNCGKLTLRYATRLHQLGIGIAHAGTKVLIIVTTANVTVLTTPDYRLIASHTIDPNRNYWRNQKNTPADGRGDL